MAYVPRFGGILLGLLTATLIALPAQPPTAAPTAPPNPDAARQQEENLKLFNEFKSALLRLALRYEASDKPEDKARAKTVRSALELADKEGVNAQFGELVKTWRSNPNQVQQIDDLLGKDQQLTKALTEILNILMTDDETARIKAEIARLSAFMKELKDLKKRQEVVRARTDAQKGDPKPIAESQGDLAKQTKDLADRMGGEKKGSPGQGKDEIAKAEPKAEAKPGDNSAEDKPDTGEDKAAPKDSAEPKDGDPKDGDAKSGPPKDAASKSSHGEAKPMGGESKPMGGGESKPMGGESKPMSGGGGSPTPMGEAKPPQPEAKAGQDTATAKNSAGGKGSDKTSAPQNGGEGKGLGGKPGEDAQGEPKSGGGQGGQGGGESGNPPPPQQQTPGRKSVQEAYPHQNDATEDLNKNQRPKASKQQDSAIEKLAKAIEELQKKLDQLREEEKLKLLANLEARCNQMLRMQTEVYENTKAIHATVVKNNNEKSNAEHQRSQQQAEREREIIVEADKALKLLEAEGSAVAFTRVLEEVKEDMIAIKRRLDATIVDTDTQSIEENVIAMLKDMIAALKKAQQDIQDKKNDPSNPNNSKQNQKLIQLLQELKLIRAMQTQVNSRTKMYGNKSKGEQATEEIVQLELKQLAVRQQKIQDMMQKIASGHGEQ